MPSAFLVVNTSIGAEGVFQTGDSLWGQVCVVGVGDCLRPECLRHSISPHAPQRAVVGLTFCRSKSSDGVRHGVFSESSLAWQPVVMVKEQKHGKKKHQRDQANEMGAKQRPFGIPGHLCQAAVSSSPLKHVVRIQ